MTRLKGLNPDWIDLSKRMPQTKTDFITRQYLNLPYGDDSLQKMDIYLPEKGKGPFPVIVNVHGGGFTHCDKHDFHLYPTLFALQQGFAVVAINYRLSPAVRYPEHYFDVMRAILWIARNCKKFKLDIDNLFLWGTSAGGNLVLQAACKEGIPLPEDLEAAREIQIRGVAAMCPAIDIPHLGGSGNIVERVGMKLALPILSKQMFGSFFFPKESVRMSNPTSYIENGIAPVYLQQGTLDPGVPFKQVEAFAKVLAKILLTKDLVFHVLEGVPHAGATEHFLLPENVNPILRFYTRHMGK